MKKPSLEIPIHADRQVSDMLLSAPEITENDVIKIINVTRGNKKKESRNYNRESKARIIKNSKRLFSGERFE